MLEEFLSEKQKRKRKRRKYLIYIIEFLFAYAFLWAVAWLFVWSPVFHVNKIVVQGVGGAGQVDVIALLQASVLRSGNSISANESGAKALFGLDNMLIWPHALPANDLAVLPKVQNITISKNYFSRTITAKVTLRKPLGIWCLMKGSEQCYWFDRQGIVFAKALDTQGSVLLVVHDSAQSALGLNKSVLDAPFVPNLASIFDVLQKSGYPASEIDLKDLSLEQIDVAGADAPALYFSLRFPSDNDLAFLQSMMAKPEFSKLRYIDFTVENRAYYK